MTKAVQSVLIIGGGFAGMSAGIEFAKRGTAVDLVEIDPEWRAYGAGLSLGGATLRVFHTLGILQEFLRSGFASDGVDLRTPDGTLVTTLPTPHLAGPDVPGGGGVMRTTLAAMLARATHAAGVQVRLGETFQSIVQDESGVDVTFTGGSQKRYDLVVGADGLFSAVRQALFPGAPVPRYSGQGVWRAVLPRPPEVERTIIWVGGASKPGVNPVSNEQMYLFVTESRASNDRLDPAGFVDALKALLAPFPAPLLRTIHDQIDAHSQIVYRPLESLLLRDAWYTGRVALIGDAVHATTPHLAAGAGLGLEDGVVLAEEAAAAPDVQAALARFQSRRQDRCRMVVENSLRLSEIEQTNGDKAEQSRIMAESLRALAEPI